MDRDTLSSSVACASTKHGKMARNISEERTKISLSPNHSYDGGTGSEPTLRLKSDGLDTELKMKGPFDTKSKKFIIACMSMYAFIMSCAYSMLAPFYPGVVLFV